jgi:hypothetical protein
MIILEMSRERVGHRGELLLGTRKKVVRRVRERERERE